MKKVSVLFIIAFLFAGTIWAQEKSSLNVKDLNSDIEKYIKKNYEGYKAVEAFKYDVVYNMKIQSGATSEVLIFDHDGKFIRKKTEADKTKPTLQTRMTIALDDVESDIAKYIKKNHEGYKLTEAYKFDEVYTTKIVKATESHVLLFDKEGKFEKVVPPAKPAEPVVKADSVPVKSEVKIDSLPVKQEIKTEPAKTDSINK